MKVDLSWDQHLSPEKNMIFTSASPRWIMVYNYIYIFVHVYQPHKKRFCSVFCTAKYGTNFFYMPIICPLRWETNMIQLEWMGTSLFCHGDLTSRGRRLRFESDAEFLILSLHFL